MKDAVATMGGLLPEDAGGRDAVHVAVFSAASDDKVFPGQHVGIAAKGSVDVMVSPNAGGKIGIVDPFLNGVIFPGQRFWVYLYPRTITGLSHRWSHPAFGVDDGLYSVPAEKLAAEKWLREWTASSDCPGYDWFIAEAEKIVEGGGDEYLTVIGNDAHGDIPDEAWRNAEIVLGRRIKGERAKYFSCSC